MTAILSAVGLDVAVVLRLRPGAVRTLLLLAVCTCGSTLLSFWGGFALGHLSSDDFAVGVAVGVVFAAIALNIWRLYHAGTGYALHLPFEGVWKYRPNMLAVAVFAAFYVMVLALVAAVLVLLMRLEWQRTTGIVTVIHAAIETPVAYAAVLLLLVTLASSPAWLRWPLVQAVRAYEAERWIGARLLVDDAFAQAQAIIVEALSGVPGFAPPLRLHYVDPPYNTTPLLFGLVVTPTSSGELAVGSAPPPSSLVVAPVASMAPVVASKRPPAPRTAPRTAPPAPVAAAPAPSPSPATSVDTLAAAAFGESTTSVLAPTAAFFDMGRISVAEAMRHIEVVGPYLARMLGEKEAAVRERLFAASSAARVHEVFPAYKSLHTIFFKDAGFALANGMSQVIAAVVQRSVADIELRLRAAPAQQRLTSVFAPELARRLQLQKKPT